MMFSSALICAGIPENPEGHDMTVKCRSREHWERPRNGHISSFPFEISNDQPRLTPFLL
jgi:hypothetical protein